jgi:hypothetical protein
MNTTTKTCKACGNEFEVNKGAGAPKYCSVECLTRPRRAQYTDRSRRLQSTYGISSAQYEEMRLAQGGVCDICAGTNTDGRMLAVDHCHQTGEVRALLCSNCNTALGLLRDDPVLLRTAAEYLEHHHARLR